MAGIRSLGIAGKTQRMAALAGFALAALTWSAALHAQAEHRPQDARATYDSGVAAHQRGDFREAARLFAEADALAPNDTALQASIDAAVQADDAVLAMLLVDRAMTRPQSQGLSAAVRDARSAFTQRTGRIDVQCLGTIRCQVHVDGRAIEPGVPSWVLAGTRVVEVSFGEQVVRKSVEVGPAAQEVLKVEPPPAPEAAPKPEARPEPKPAAPPPPTSTPPREEKRSVLSSPWFWIGAGLTTTFAAASIWSANDVSGQHDDFVRAGCDKQGNPDCDSAASDGKDAQLRTNLLLGATALFGAATVVVTVVPWGGSGDETGGKSSARFLPVVTARGTF